MLKGVISVTPGYAGGFDKLTTGGAKKVPTYDDVCSGKTGHAEVIKIEYEPDKISFRELLTVFFATHDPITPNRQGADLGTQYRSIILYTNDDQRREAKEFIKELNNSHTQGDRVITEVKPLASFYEAENYHKDYYAKNPSNPYCQIVINPKLEKVQKEFAELLNKE